MQWEDHGQGRLRKNLSGKLAYYSFMPTRLQDIVPIALDANTVGVLGACSRKLGELEGMLKFVPNANMYLTMYVRKEALLSAQIENTQCTFDDVLDPSSETLLEKDVRDVIAYVRATEHALSRLKDLPLCMRLLCEVHAELLEGTRGGDKQPGAIRNSQNWIGPAGCTLKEAAYVPPNAEDMAEALSDLERFINDERAVDPIVKAALVHYQFETIHPFLDGNGRLGRLLITLSLLNDKVLSGAIFYPSYQLKLDRSAYYQALTDVRERGSYLEWIAFFCRCMLAAAEDAVEALGQLVELRNRTVDAINEYLGRSAANGQRLLVLLEEHPIIEIPFIEKQLEVSRTTASNLVKCFVDLGILSLKENGKKRYRTYLYEEYLAILRRGGEPLSSKKKTCLVC